MAEIKRKDAALSVEFQCLYELATEITDGWFGSNAQILESQAHGNPNPSWALRAKITSDQTERNAAFDRTLAALIEANFERIRKVVQQ